MVVLPQQQQQGGAEQQRSPVRSGPGAGTERRSAAEFQQQLHFSQGQVRQVTGLVRRALNLPNLHLVVLIRTLVPLSEKYSHFLQPWVFLRNSYSKALFLELGKEKLDCQWLVLGRELGPKERRSVATYHMPNGQIPQGWAEFPAAKLQL